jgi:enoyl-[acyl-carrier protein] reductase I
MSGLTELFVSLPQIYNKKSMSYNLLKGKRGIVFGALNEQSIAWKVAEKAVEEGAVITLSNTPVAVRMGEVSALAEKLNCEVITAPSSTAFSATFHAIDCSFRAPKTIPLFPFSKL